MRIAIVGAGPAGSHLAHQLAIKGFDVDLFDAREAWEKPCGGGVTSKALRDFSFLRNGDAPRQMISSVRLVSASNVELKIEPADDFAIFSRRELSRFMRNRAVEAGAAIHCKRVEKTDFSNGKWRLETPAGEFTADFLVGADGASSVIRRRMGVRFDPDDFAFALGWHIKTDSSPSQVDVKYLDELSGYQWLFPRSDHLSFGIATGYRETTPDKLKDKLVEFIETYDKNLGKLFSQSNAQQGSHFRFYAALIPSLSVSTWDRLKACNNKKSWALIGDAAGFVDPLTGEGIYYAIKSAELLAQALTDRTDTFDERWRADFGHDLRRASQLQNRFYNGKFAGAPLTERMIQIAGSHRGIRSVLCDLVAGDQPYLGLKSRLIRSLPAFV